MFVLETRSWLWRVNVYKASAISFDMIVCVWLFERKMKSGLGSYVTGRSRRRSFEFWDVTWKVNVLWAFSCVGRIWLALILLLALMETVHVGLVGQTLRIGKNYMAVGRRTHA